jgi:hypothetical protein
MRSLVDWFLNAHNDKNWSFKFPLPFLKVEILYAYSLSSLLDELRVVNHGEMEGFLSEFQWENKEVNRRNAIQENETPMGAVDP